MAQDYNFKPSFDVTGAASLIQKKALAEQDQKNLEIERQYRALKDVIETGRMFAQDAVVASKRRQQKEFADALADSQMTPGQTVMTPQATEPTQGMVPTPNVGMRGEGATPPLSSYTAGRPFPVTEAAENPDGTVSPVMPEPIQTQIPPQENPKSALYRAAANANPDEAAKQYFEKEFDTTRDYQKLPNGGQMAFQRFTMKGSDGRPRPVTVGVVGTSMVNPFTMQPVDPNNPADVDALVKTGFVNREVIAGTDADGKPVYQDPIDRRLYTKDDEGNPIPYEGGTLFPANTPPSDRQSDDLQAIREARSNIRDGFSHYKEQFVGPVAGRFGTVKEWFNSLTDEEQVDFRSFMAEIDLIRRNNYFGATLTQGEKQAFNQVSLDTKLSPKAFVVRVNSLVQKLNNREKALMGSSKAAGKPFRDEPQPMDPLSPGGGTDLGNGWSYEIVQ